jgi:hypothetical protein
MKKILLTLTAVCTGLLSMAQLTGVVTEAYTLTNALSTQPAGTTTYRVYAECGTALDKITAVYAILDCHPLNVSTTTNFFNDTFGGSTPVGINPAFYAVFPTIEADSWVTIGVDDSTDGGASDVGTAATAPTTNPFAPAFNVVGGGDFIMTDGAVFTLPTSPSSLPSGPLNRILLGQFTTDGDLSFNINVQMFVGGDQVNGRADYVHTAGCDGAGNVTGFEVSPGDANYPPGLTYPAAASCLDTEVTFDMADSFGDGWNDATYEIFTDLGVSVAAGDLSSAETGDGFSIGTDLVCLADGCYELVVGGGDFDIEIDWTLTGADISPISGGAPSTTLFSINTVCAVLGCIDPTACNFDPAADTDDGSCILPAANDLSADAIVISGTGVEAIDNANACQNEGLAGACQFGGDPEQSSLWYVFTTTADAAVSLSTSDAIGADSQLTVYDASFNEVACNDDDPLGGLLSVIEIACGDIPAGTYYVQFDGYNGLVGTWDLNYSIDEAACLVTLGCTDPLACNFDVAADTDDGSCCLGTCADLVVNGGGFPTEVSFDVFDGGGTLVYSGTGVDGTVVLCLPGDGCYQVDMLDSFGDGWNSASVEIFVGGVSQGSVNLDDAPIGDGFSIGTDYIDVGATGSCPVFGCTDPLACNYDVTATDDNGSCIAGPCINDLPGLAYALSMDALGTCNGLVGEDMDAATVVAPVATYNSDDNDLWYSFVPMTSGVRLEVNTVDFDAVVEIYDAGLTLVDLEDAVFINGGEVLNIGSLTAGDTYTVRVSPWIATAGPALFDICVQSIPDTRCDYGSGPYDLCDLFKADWVGADDYIFTFTGSDLTDYVYQAGAANTFVVLSGVAGLEWDDTYTVSINSVFMLADGNGIMEAVEVQNDEPCSIDVNPQPLAVLRASDNAVNYGAHYLGDYIAATPFVCGVIDWTWEFTNTDGSQLPITHSRGAANRYMRLSDVSGLVPGATYDAIVKPEFAGGGSTIYGAIDQISIIGPAGIVAEIESVVVIGAEANRADVVEATLGMYPNPASDIVNINITNIAEGVTTVMVDILDQTGRLVVAEQVSVNGSSMLVNMSVNDLANGMYNVRITMNGTQTVERLIIQK